MPLVLAILLVILVALYFVVSTSSCGKTSGETAVLTPEVTEAAESQPVVSGAEAAPSAAPAETNVPEAPSEVFVLEDEGDLEIIIPEGMDSDGL